MKQREIEILKILADRRENGDPPPTYRELSVLMGMTHTVNGVAYWIRQLVAKGYLKTEYATSRSFEITESGLKAIGRETKYREVPILNANGLRALCDKFTQDQK